MKTLGYVAMYQPATKQRFLKDDPPGQAIEHGQTLAGLAPLKMLMFHCKHTNYQRLRMLLLFFGLITCLNMTGWWFEPL